MGMLKWRDAFSALGSFGVLFSLVSGYGCGTDAKAVDECRDIEQARCDAAHSCGVVDDVDACKRFYRDHCLHGMVVESPGQSRVDQCVSTIKAAGVCAQSSADIALADCPNSVSAAATGVTTACDVVLYPERTAECAFLAPDEPVPMPDADSGTNYADAGDPYAAIDSGSDAAAGAAGTAGAGG
jgi:hypothetical protein